MKRALLLGWLLGVAFILAFFQSATAAPSKVTICHATGNGSYITLTLPYNAVFGKSEASGHFNEQGTPNSGHENDYLGPCLPPPTTTTTTTTTPPTTSSTTSSTVSPTTSTTSTSSPTTTTSTPPRRLTTTTIVIDTCEDVGGCDTTTTAPTTTDPACGAACDTTTSSTVDESTTTTAPPSTLADGGSDAARMFTPWALLVTLLGGFASWIARRPI